MGKVLVFGATGYTGTLVARELARRDVAFVIAGRSEEKLVRLKDDNGFEADYRIASPDDPASLKGLFEGVDVVINTVGPFAELGEPVVKAALEQGVHYLDTTGEQDFMLAMIEKYDALAQARKKVVVNAQAFEYAVGDCAAAIALGAIGGRAECLEVFNQVSAAGASKGTVKSAYRMFGKPSLVWNRGRLVEERPGAVASEIHFPGDREPRAAMTIPGGEPLHVHRFADVGFVRTCIVVPAAANTVMKYAGVLLQLADTAPVKSVLDRLVDRFNEPPAYEESSRDRFRVAARAVNGGVTKTCIVSGRDPYGITAAITVEGARMLLKGPPKRYGVVSTSMAFGGEEFLAALKPDGVSWTVS